ncbi:LOW QUALITY PROTEIN: hypothetical protein, conserved [Eimeria necatrix]|uniref:Uncharacterized protein n=1 Tax=Eimeria necatrix TaxID=51315 RepID=U6MVW2_9EIME|nr:LOW QUALITY PROTEIN: hypothetical protein, conserved [Eimeria necatrix]CDJ66619.1 hypothetical protein, conserved [Eimeria necatrix]
MDQWMNNLLGAMTTLESDPTALYEYLKGTGSLTDVLKSSCLFGLSIIAGAIVAVVYLLCCLPTICCKYLRRLCCCSKCCSGKSGLCSRIVWAIFIAALTLMGIVFACLVLHYQNQGVEGARQLQCQTYEFANETLRGTEALQGNDTQADTPLPDEFEGLLPLVDNVEALVLLFDASNPDNVVELSKQAATKALDVVPISDKMNTAIGNLGNACVAFSANNSLSGSFHKSMWCDAVNDPSASIDIEAIEEQMSNSAKVIVAVDPKKQLDKIFENVELPVLNVKEIFPIGTVKELFLTAFDALASTEGIVSKALQWLDIGLKVDCSFYLAILLLIALWTIWFFCRGAGAGSGTPALLWNVLAWVVVIFLIFGGALGWVMTIGRQGCSVITNTCLEEDNWELLSDYAPVVEPLISECLSKEGEGDMLAAVGAKEAFNQVLDTLKKTLGSFPTDMAPLDEKTSVDQDSVANARKNVFPEFLKMCAFSVLALSDFASCFKSGVQIQDVDLGGETLYGLATLESLVSPWKLHALHPEEPADGEFIVTDVIPIEADSDYVRWLEELKESKVAMYRALGGGVACLVLLALFILWFKLKFGKETKKSSSREKAPV